MEKNIFEAQKIYT